jgi:hypothetical protein
LVVSAVHIIVYDVYVNELLDFVCVSVIEMSICYGTPASAVSDLQAPRG